MKATFEKCTLVTKLLLKSDLNGLGKLLNTPVKVALDDTHIWVCYHNDDKQIASITTCLSGHHFQLLENDLLVPHGAAVATERLPEMQWQPLSKFLEFKLPIAAMSGRITPAHSQELKLLRGGEERTADAGLYALDELVRWVDAVPRFRLQRLEACVSGRDVLVIGNPLPAIACKFLCRDGRLLTPAGLTWYPRIDAEQVLAYFDITADQILLWTESNEWSSIPIEIIKPLQRGSVRAFVGK